ncbi:MAG: hypothetical protein R3C01_10940 [Planctomycetaceae bacterium]
MSHEEQILRAVECEVLDRQHLQYSLLQRNASDAVAAVLRCYGDIVRGLQNGSIPKDTDDARHQTANEGFRGLSHCLRWIRSSCPRLIAVPSVGLETLHAEALELLRWGVQYDPLCNQHIALSRRVNGRSLVTATVSEAKKHITFVPCDPPDPRYFVSQVEARKAEDLRQVALYPDQQLAQLSSAWYESVQRDKTGFRFDDSTIATSGVLDVVIEWLQRTCLPECPDERQLGTFKAGSLRRILAALHVASLFQVKLEEVSDQQDPQLPRVLTHVLSWRREELLDWLYRLTGVDRTQIRAMILMLIFDSEPLRVTLAHKPLVLGADDRIFLSPRLFLGLPLSQMVVGALNLNSVTKAAYDDVSTSIEKAVVQRIGGDIRSGCLSNCTIALEKTYRLPDGTQITPDIVALAADGSELLIVDVKNATPPFGAGDVAVDLKTWVDEWQPQLCKYVAAFKDHPKILSQHFSTSASAPRVFGLILTRWPFPIPVEIPSGLGAIDWSSLHHELTTGSASRSMQDLEKWVQERPDCGVVTALKWKDKVVQVEGWTYQYSVLSPSNGTGET